MKKKTNSDFGHLRLFRISGFVLRISAFVAISVGCSSRSGPTTRPSSVRDRQNAALEDPFGYSPNMGENDISGGKLHELDRGAMRKDIDHVLNP